MIPSAVLFWKAVSAILAFLPTFKVVLLVIDQFLIAAPLQMLHKKVFEGLVKQLLPPALLRCAQLDFSVFNCSFCYAHSHVLLWTKKTITYYSSLLWVSAALYFDRQCLVNEGLMLQHFLYLLRVKILLSCDCSVFTFWFCVF